MFTPRSLARTQPAENQEEARVPPIDSTMEINSMLLPHPVPGVAVGHSDVFVDPTWSMMAPLHPFNKDNANIWFIQAEACMNMAKVTNDTIKFYYIISQLDPDILFLVKDIIDAPPATNKYPAIKNKLLQLFSQEIEPKVLRLLKCRRGNEKPSHFLQRLKSLARKKIPDIILKVIFLEQVPEALRYILLVDKNADLAELASIADEIISFELSINEAVHTRDEWRKEYHMTAICQTLSHQITQLASKLSQLKLELSQLQLSERQRKHRLKSQRNKHVPFPAQPNSEFTEQNSELCYYHRRYGDHAHRCAIPCTWLLIKQLTNVTTADASTENEVHDP
ncbi:hypothetical protein K0M31_020477 [Melipona bicolor]|uniref:DUF7041 domain-containing protein n=1 Tax=Melipona bicolor TaxID=60889 RepID=A0AA40KLJ7_9HYME|nr:hypothetical protein K0M31_020477 [Melipona bicolor]